MFGSQKNEEGKRINPQVSKSPESKKQTKNPREEQQQNSKIQEEPSKWISKIYRYETF